MHANGIISLVATVLLCLPSFAGILVVVLNASLHRQMSEWGKFCSLSVAAAVFIGWPLLLLAAAIAGLVGLSRRIPQSVKYAHYAIITLATVSTIAITFHFGM